MRRPALATQLGLDLLAAPAPAPATVTTPAAADERNPLDGQLTARALFARYLARWGAQAFACSEGGCAHV